MEIVVHGTKGGYRILYPKDAPPIANDVRSNADIDSALGKSAYAISFYANGCVFSKYVIVRDSLRNSATGFIGFSLLMPDNEKLPNQGSDIKRILDDLSLYYCQNYISDNNINNGQSNIIIHENWDFVENILHNFEIIPANNQWKDLKSGNQEAAYIYYSFESEIEEYYSKPFQPEYLTYKQVILIKNNPISHSSDLLNTFRNSGIEIPSIDLDNDIYFFNNYDPAKSLTIISNEKPLFANTLRSFLRRKDRITLKYAIPYYNTFEIEGCLSDSNSAIENYLEIMNNQEIRINYYEIECAAKFYPIKKTINFNIINYKKKPISKIELKIYSGHTQMFILENKITFKGTDLANKWTISVDSKEGFYLDSYEIDFSKQFPSDTNDLTLIINTKKVVEIICRDKENKQIITGFEVKWKRINGYKKTNKIILNNDEIDKTWTITIRHKDYPKTNVDYHPGQNLLEIQLNKYVKKTKLAQSNIIVGILISSLIIALGVYSLKSLLFKDKVSLQQQINNNNLNQIATEIDSIATLFSNNLEDLKKQDTYPETNITTSNSIDIDNGINNQNNGGKSSNSSSIQPSDKNNQLLNIDPNYSVNPNIDHTIENELREDRITNKMLVSYREKYSNYSESIDLYIQFWNLVKTDPRKIEEFKKLHANIKNDKVLKESELKILLDLICSSHESFKEFSSRSGLGITLDNIYKIKKAPK